MDYYWNLMEDKAAKKHVLALYQTGKQANILLAEQLADALTQLPKSLSQLNKLRTLSLLHVKLSPKTYQDLKTALPNTTIDVSKGYVG